MKAVLRSVAGRVLGPRMKHHVADLVGRAMLKRVPSERLDASCLRRAGTVDLAEVFNDDQIREAWERDSEAVFSKWPSASGAGSVNRGDCRAIYYLVAKLKPKKVVEIGTNVAGSSIFIAQALRTHSTRSAKLTTVDIVDINGPTGPWSKTKTLTKAPAEYAADFGLAKRIEFVTQPALEYLTSGARADLIFLDGSHAHNDVYREVAVALKALSPDGLILLHDYYPSGSALFDDTAPLMGPYRAIERYRVEGAEVEVRPFGELPWPTRPNAARSFSSLALLLRKPA